MLSNPGLNALPAVIQATVQHLAVPVKEVKSQALKAAATFFGVAHG
jgi:hypothetical protein